MGEVKVQKKSPRTNKGKRLMCRGGENALFDRGSLAQIKTFRGGNKGARLRGAFTHGSMGSKEI